MPPKNLDVFTVSTNLLGDKGIAQEHGYLYSSYGDLISSIIWKRGVTRLSKDAEQGWPKGVEGVAVV
jgi:hypothetical protein